MKKSRGARDGSGHRRSGGGEARRPAAAEPDLARLRELLSEVGREWRALRDDVARFRGFLESESFEEAIARAGLGSLPPEPEEPAAPAADAGGKDGKEAGRLENASRPAEIPAELTAQLEELLRLLRESRAAWEAGNRELPHRLTLDIAREVARSLKDSVLAEVRSAAAEAGSAPGPTQRAEEPKIPLDDIAAMVDHLNRRS